MLGLSALPDFTWGSGDDELMGGAYSDVLGRFATLESGGGRFRSNPMSSARGLLHFMPDTWKGVLRNYPDLGFTPEDIDDDAKQKRAAEVLMEREIVPALRRTLGREPTGAELYTAWALGTPDAQKLFGADPNTPAASLFRPKVASSNPSIFYRDKEATMPRTVAEVAAEYARRWSGAKPTKEPTMQQPEYDVDEGLANVARMGQRVAQMQPAGVSALPDRQPGQGLSALSPYLQIASQLMPQREGRPWADALINAGAAMMQSRSPDFLGGLGAGLQAGNQTLTQGQNLARQDTLDRFKLGMQLAQFDQKDGGEWAMNEGVLFNKKTGQTQQVGAGKAPQTRVVERGDKKITQEWNGAIWKDIAEAPRTPDDRTLTPVYDPNSPTGVRLVPREQAAGQPGPLPPGWSVEVGKDGQVKIVQGSMGGRPTQTDPVTGLSNEVLKEIDKNMESAQRQAMQVHRFTQQYKPIFQTIPERGRMWGAALQERLGMDPGADAKASLAEFTRYKSEAAQFFADRIKEMSGAAVTDGEAKRQTAYLPNVGSGLFDGDSPTEFEAKVGRMLNFFDAATARLHYIRKAGLGISSMKDIETKMPLDQVPKMIRTAIEQAKSGLAADYPNASAETLEAYAIRRVARDFGLMDNSPLFGASAPPPAPGARPSAAPGLPPSDADIRRQNAPAAPPNGGIIPGPKRFDLAPKVGAQPQGDAIPKFTDPADPALAKLPSGSVFYDGNGTLRVKP